MLEWSSHRTTVSFLRLLRRGQATMQPGRSRSRSWQKCMLKSQRCITHIEFQFRINFHSESRSQLLQPPTVDCGSRPEPPPVETCDSCTPMGKCPCPWGYFPDPHDCNQYVYCQVGYQFQQPFLAPSCEERFFLLMPGRWLSRRIRLL